MAGEWREATVGEIASSERNALVGGPFGSNLVSRDYVDIGVPVIRGQNMGERWIGGEFAYVTAEKADSLSANIARPGDVVFTQRGTLGQVAVVPKNTAGRYVISQSQMKLTVDDSIADPLFVYYVFRSSEQRDYVSQNAIQTGVPHTNLGILRGTPVSLPPIEEQRSIAHILGTLDDKIELNRRMNETLEEMARAIFKSWFVDFDPVRAKSEGRGIGLPEHMADLFPDRFEDSELGGIPAGWSVGTLGEVAENPRRSIKPERMDESTPYIGLEHMPRRSISLTNWDSSGNLESNKYEFERGEILFGKLRPYFHKVGIAPVDGICSTDILVVAAKEPEWFGFALGHVSSENFVNYTTATSSGTKMPRTNWKDMSGYGVVAPPLSLAKAFNSLIQPFMERTVENIHESRTLASLRDALLPKLISGELRVGEARVFVEGKV